MKASVSKSDHLRSLIAVNAAQARGAKDHYESLGLQYVSVPQMVGITGACENIDTLFRVGNRLDLPLFLSQTGQLALEQALQFYHGVYTTIHSGRDEIEEDARHLREFGLTEEEFDCTMAGMSDQDYDDEKMMEALIQHIELAVKAMIRAVAADCGRELESLYGQDIGYLRWVLDTPFCRVSYEDAIAMLNKNGFAELRFGDDLKAAHEQRVVELVSAERAKGNQEAPLLPCFIMRYPWEIKFFNMKRSLRDPRVVLSTDLILPKAGEATGAAVREHDGEKLKQALLRSTMFRLHRERGGRYEDFTWYVEGIVGAGKTRPHGGYGIGNERVLQFLLAQDDIRDCSIFSMMSRDSGDWDATRRGKYFFFTPAKKKVLLSIGGIFNKEELLENLKAARGEHVIYYATEGTHGFLAKHGVESTLVHKISEETAEGPNISMLLQEGFFDVIINLPTPLDNPRGEITDGRMIRRSALKTGTSLVTDLEVAKDFFGELAGFYRAQACARPRNP